MYGEAVRENAYNVSHPLSGVYLFSLPFYLLQWPIWIGIIGGALVGVSAGYRATKHHIMQQKLKFYERNRKNGEKTSVPHIVILGTGMAGFNETNLGGKAAVQTQIPKISQNRFFTCDGGFPGSQNHRSPESHGGRQSWGRCHPRGGDSQHSKPLAQCQYFCNLHEPRRY
jgi:hypothetical protein